MVTPAENETRHSVAMFSFRKIYNRTNELTDQGSGLRQFVSYERFRPKSVTNPIRTDGTRKPSSWQSRWLKTTAISGVVTTAKDRNFSGGSDNNSRGYGYGAIAVPPSFMWRADIRDCDRLLDNARLKALSRVTDGVMQLNAALLQARSTVGLATQFANAASSRLDALMGGADHVSVRNGRRRRYKDGLFARLGRISGWREMPAEYLAYLYGLAPLADDLTNAVHAFHDRLDGGADLTLHLKAAMYRQENGIPRQIPTGTGGVRSGLSLTGNMASGANPTVMFNKLIAARVSYRFDLPKWKVERPIMAPFSTAWEIAPYSFVVDWMVPINSWVQALESAQYAPFFKEGSETRFVRDTCNFSTLTVNPMNHSSGYTARGSGNFESGEMDRQYVGSYPWSVLTPPRVIPRLGINHFAQASALLTQAFKRWY